jgi:hypothetical protein
MRGGLPMGGAQGFLQLPPQVPVLLLQALVLVPQLPVLALE